ncbi:MAG TPA: PilX N-terminal domain-containing pilus assembly protein [Terriglobales bacterium]|nr:PilX N-terminal domain-containing pilus assembly protein [Terriglobales bacterium]
MRNPRHNPERGSSLIVVIIVMAFMLAVGVAILAVTGIAPKVSGSVRDQEEAFNSAEAGFDAARLLIEHSLLDGTWANLQDNCCRTPAGIDLPLDANYYRRQSDAALSETLTLGTTGVLYKDQPFLKTVDGHDDTTRTYTVFIIDDEAGGGVVDPTDVMLVCIGVVRSGSRILATSRLEVLLGLETVGGNP